MWKRWSNKLSFWQICYLQNVLWYEVAVYYMFMRIDINRNSIYVLVWFCLLLITLHDHNYNYVIKETNIYLFMFLNSSIFKW